MSQYMGFAKTALKNLFSKPVTTSYPEKPKIYPERTRGHVEVSIEECILCGLCMRSCPPGAIRVNRGTSTWSISGFDCIQCGYCVEKCPKKCLKIVPGYTAPSRSKRTTVINKPVVEETQPQKPEAVAKPEPVAKAEVVSD